MWHEKFSHSAKTLFTRVTKKVENFGGYYNSAYPPTDNPPSEGDDDDFSE